MGKHFLWDPVEDNIVKEIDDSGITIADYTTEPFLYGDLISQHRDGQSSFYHYDGQGSTTSLSDSVASVIDTYAYSAFGELTAHSGSTVNRFQYIGRNGALRIEMATYMLLLIRRRTLNALLQRWISIDPLYMRSVFQYPYSLSNNNPSNRVDPSGLFSSSAGDPTAEEKAKAKERCDKIKSSKSGELSKYFDCFNFKTVYEYTQEQQKI